MLQITFYVPVDHCEAVKEAMFAAGAGRIGAYAKCAWQTLGEGQFLALAESNPYIGQAGTLERVREYKVEMVCLEAVLAAVLQALKASHPYEGPAYQVILLEN
jgi:hypothetical protein